MHEHQSVRVSILDQAGNERAISEPTTETATDHPVKWAERPDLAGLKGKQIRLRFQLRNAKLYAFQIKNSA